MRLSRRELLGYAVAGTTGMGITAAARPSGEGTDAGDGRSSEATGPNSAAVGQEQYWRLGGVHARPAKIRDTAITFRASVDSSYDTDYEVEVRLHYRPKETGAAWQKLAQRTAPLSEGIYLESTATGLETGTTYQYHAEAYLTNYDGQSRRVSEVHEVTAGQPCSGPSTNCLRVETLAPEVSGDDATLRGRVDGLDSYDSVTVHFFYRREGGNKQWTDYEPVEAGSDGATEFSATLSNLPAGTYTYYAEARGEGGEMKNMYAEGEKRTFSVE